MHTIIPSIFSLVKKNKQKSTKKIKESPLFTPLSLTRGRGVCYNGEKEPEDPGSRRGVILSDYELYGDYNRGEDEEPSGPAPSRFGVAFKTILKALVIILLAGACLVMAFRMIVSGYYPRDVKYLYHTEALTAYAAASGQPEVVTQKIRVPFESEILESDEIERAQNAKSQNGYFYAANLRIVRGTGSVQFSLRMNNQALKDIAAAYGVGEITSVADAFTFTLTDPEGRHYTTTATLTDEALFYQYIKLCFDGVVLDDVAWLRVEIGVVGADMTAEEHPTLAICVYENNEAHASFDTYRLHRKEKF